MFWIPLISSVTPMIKVMMTYPSSGSWIISSPPIIIKRPARMLLTRCILVMAVSFPGLLQQGAEIPHAPEAFLAQLHRESRQQAA